MSSKLICTSLLALGTLLGGCDVLPAPVQTITAPQSPAARSTGTTSTLDFIRTFLPSDAHFLPPAVPSGSQAVQLHELDGDAQAEIVVLYESGGNYQNTACYVVTKSTWQMENDLELHMSFWIR